MNVSMPQSARTFLFFYRSCSTISDSGVHSAANHNSATALKQTTKSGRESSITGANGSSLERQRQSIPGATQLSPQINVSCLNTTY
jgi:hypothetical protein